MARRKYKHDSRFGINPKQKRKSARYNTDSGFGIGAVGKNYLEVGETTNGEDAAKSKLVTLVIQSDGNIKLSSKKRPDDLSSTEVIPRQDIHRIDVSDKKLFLYYDKGVVYTQKEIGEISRESRKGIKNWAEKMREKYKWER